MKQYGFIDAYQYPDCDFHQEYEILEKAGYGFKLGNCRSDEEVIEFAKDCEVICTVYYPITEKLLEGLPNLKAVIRSGVGVDCVDLDACTRHNVWCCNLPTYCLEDVSTMAVTLLLDLLRKVTFFDRDCRRGEWNVGYGSYKARRISALTVGLLGFGNIARSTYHMLKPMGAKLIAYDPFLPDSVFESNGCERVTLDELLERSDAISIHVPATKDTFHLIDEKTIAKMKDGVFLINTARGPIVSQDALVAACKSGKIGAAALDVVEHEPITETDHPLYQCDNIIVTPHVSYNTAEASDAMHVQAAETAVIVMNGGVPSNRVNMR